MTTTSKTDIETKLTNSQATKNAEHISDTFLYLKWNTLLQDWFYFDIHKIIKFGRLHFENIPDLPPSLSVNVAHNEWKQTFQTRQNQHLSTSTSKMIFSTQKNQIILLLLLQIIVWSLLLFTYYIIQLLWIELNKVNDTNSNILNISKFAFIIFIIFTFKSIIATYVMSKSWYLCTKIASSLYLSLFAKTLSLDLNECDKQQILNIIYSDIQAICDGFWFLNAHIPPVALSLVLSMSLLSYIIGLSAVFGIMFMLFIGVPLQLYAGYNLSYYSNLRMQCSDKRVQLIAELIRGIRVLKVSCYELPLMRRVNQYRQEELQWISKRNLCFSCIILANFFVPAIMLFIILMMYCFVFEYQINSTITLLILMLFTLIQMGVRGIPVVVGSIASFMVSCKRLDAFLQRKSVVITSDDIAIEHCSDTAINIINASFTCNTSDESIFVLNNITVNIKRNKLVAIIGSVGCGKTKLIQSILGELQCVSGDVQVNREDIVYCSQIPFIRNMTVRENIVMELAFDALKYQQCIHAAALHSDLKRLPQSDFTIVGDEGVTLSGGQKMRLSFARALYRHNKRQNQIYLFDDTLSCVDIYVGRQMFFDGIHNYLMHREQSSCNVTCLMVINSHLHLLQYFDEIILMNDGTMQAHKTIDELYFDANNTSLLQKNQHLLPSAHQMKPSIKYENNYTAAVMIPTLIYEQAPKVLETEALYPNHTELIPNWSAFVEFIKSSLSSFDFEAHWYNNTEAIAMEHNMIHNKCKLIMLVIPTIACFIILCSAPACDVWILYWNQQIEIDRHAANTRNTLWYLSIWFLLLFVIAFGTLYAMYSFSINIALKASDYIHCKSLYNILRANTLFYDLSSIGDIMKTFSNETSTMDITFPQYVYQLILFTSLYIGYLVMISILIPLSLIPNLIIFPIIIYVYWRFELCFFSVILIEKECESKIGALFSDTASNLDSIRSYKLQHHFTNELKQRIADTRKCNVLRASLSGWLALYQQFLLMFVQMIAIMISIYHLKVNQNEHYTQFITLSFWYLLAMQHQIDITSKMYCLSKYAFTAIMKLRYYHHIFESNKKNDKEVVHEAKQINHDNNEELWPHKGDIVIDKLQLRYRRKLDVVLDINQAIHIQHGEKIGVCGRTGSGKSSFLVSLLRLFEPIIGSKVDINGKNIFNLGLHDLRSNISIIPQKPILFNGDLRFNLDPWNKFEDAEIWNVLKSVQLFDLIQNRESKLNCVVEENGSNFSVGQKQLICFARCMLRKTKILFMDEATSSIDKHSDSIIQKLIRSEIFQDVTVICIAHRLQTIIDYDYILLLKQGKIEQFDAPHNLLADENGEFLHLIKLNQCYNHNINL